MSIPILDTHQHLVYADRWPYSWTHDIPQLAAKSFTHEDYLTAVEDTGIAASVFMETTPDDPHWPDETRFVEQLSRQPGSLIHGLIANCRPEDEDGFPRYLESVLSDRLVGFRRFLHAVPDETSAPPHFAENVRRLAEHKLTFDLCVLARQLPIAVRIAKACPDVQFVLDHCGVPAIAADDSSVWQEGIRQVAELPNVACKISGVLAYCKPDEASATTVRPYVEKCIELFGWDRVVWGGDWPVVTTTSNLAAWVRISRELMQEESEDRQQRLFHENAERIYRVQLNPDS